MVKRLGRVAMLLACAASPVMAKGWDPPGYTVRMNAFGTSNAFPGSANTGPDRGLEPAAELETGRRFLKDYKLGVSASAGARMQQEFSKANYGWFGLGGTVRRAKTTFTLEGEWTPQRNKFPSDPEEGGPFVGTSLTAGLRQAVGTRTRLRLEGTVDREAFDALNADRNAHGRELYGLVQFAPLKGTEFRVEGTVARDVTQSRKYTKSARWWGVGGVWTLGSTRADLGARSGLRHYTEAIFGDSNFERRDQYVELRLRLTHPLRTGLTGVLGMTSANQLSSRLDRNYDARTLTLGLEWTGGGK